MRAIDVERARYKLERQNFDDGEVLGMMISRRPNSRASSENAPGPRKARAMDITITSTMSGLVSNRVPVDPGSEESTAAMVLTATMMLATGVIRPITTKALLATARKTAAQVTKLRSCQLAR